LVSPDSLKSSAVYAEEGKPPLASGCCKGKAQEPAEEESYARFSAFAPEEGGASLVEYGIIAAGVCLAIAMVILQIDGHLNTTFETLAPALRP
jgi:Flp pilus assembly pilin Flp